MQNLIDNITNWIKEKVEEAKKDGAVIGISGGLDSTITAFLCKKALGEKSVLGLVMPCHSQSEILEDAKIVENFLKIPIEYIDLSSIYDAFLSILPAGNRTSQSNLKARLRMVT
ncbi:MAG: NAD(+) synthase, partial [Candidatus Ratteibacteria bacterium]|nr:NAD(+) synthase [Candidatus Ratteibacteria bacterium]